MFTWLVEALVIVCSPNMRSIRRSLVEVVVLMVVVVVVLVVVVW